MYGALSDERTGLRVCILQCTSLTGQSREEPITIHYCLNSDSPNLEGPVPKSISHRHRVVQLYPRALGSLFDTYGNGGGILTHFHTWIFAEETRLVASLYKLDTDRTENLATNSSVVAFLFVAYRWSACMMMWESADHSVA
jgi:hypothetical protein